MKYVAGKRAEFVIGSEVPSTHDQLRRQRSFSGLDLSNGHRGTTGLELNDITDLHDEDLCRSSVGMTGIEPATSSPPDWRASRLRYIPM